MNGQKPSNTVKWLSMRNWCSSHHHIRCPDKLLKTGTNEKLVKSLIEKYYKHFKIFLIFI